MRLRKADYLCACEECHTQRNNINTYSNCCAGCRGTCTLTHSNTHASGNNHLEPHKLQALVLPQ